MASPKSYTVQYNIVANAEQAITTFSSIQKMAGEIGTAMQTLQRAMGTVNSTLQQLKGLGKLTFTPEISIAGFRNQIRQMVTEVETAAGQMQTALSRGLTANRNPGMGAGIKAATRDLKTVQAQIKDTQSSINSIVGYGGKGTLRSGDFVPGLKSLIKYEESATSELGRLMMAYRKHSGSEAAGARESKEQVRAQIAQKINSLQQLQRQLVDLKEEESQVMAFNSRMAKEQEEAQKKAAAKSGKSKGAATTKKGVSTASQQPYLTNVTPATIKAWDKVFGGKTKSRTLTIYLKGNATDVMAKIKTVTAEIGKLQALGKIEILPTLNMAAVTAVKEEWAAQMGTLGNIKVSPITQTKGKGKATATNAIPANIKITGTQVTEALKAIKRPTLPVYIKLAWDKGAIGKNEQLKALQQKIPPIMLRLDVTEAETMLAEFLGKIRAASPQNIKLTATGTAAGGAAGKSAAGGAGRKAGKTVVAPGRYGPLTADERQTAIRDARLGFSGLTPYEKKLQAQEEKARKLQEKQHQKAVKQRYDRMVANTRNQIAPYVETKAQLDLLSKNAIHLQSAIKSTGIDPRKGPITSAQKVTLLQAMASSMSAANKDIWPVQNEINKLQRSAGAAMVPYRAKTAPRMSMYDRYRKWAYPLTGTTSFGQRTPMAVDMAKSMGVIFAIGGAMSAIGSSFSQAIEYQNIMETTKAILANGSDNYSIEGFNEMQKLVREVGVKTKFSAPEVASAAKFLAMSGKSIPEINAAIKPIADLALISDADLGEVADKVTNIMSNFNIPADKMRGVVNILTNTATKTNTDPLMLSESAKYGSGLAYTYGKEDPNLLADTMALFGVMGNAGVQGSSAGTALRMMYQNIFNPNKKQRAILDDLEKRFGIATEKDGKRISMADFVMKLANVDMSDFEKSKIIGQLFRITSIPGASATITAGEIQRAAEQEGTDAAEVKKGLDEFKKFLKTKGLSKLADLIRSNRQSVNSTISEDVALKKQNTIHGLWAQVSSMFTEAIVRAFEQNQGYLTEMLGKLRDYLAKPETVQMIKNLFDMLIGIGECLATFVGWWAKLYNMFPGIVKNWIIIQMAITQIGSLVTPFIQLLSVVNRLGVLLGVVNSAGAATATRAVVGSVAGSALTGGLGSAAAGAAGATGASAASGSIRTALATAALTGPAFLAKDRSGKPVVITGKAAEVAKKAVTVNRGNIAAARSSAALSNNMLTAYLATMGLKDTSSNRRWVAGVGGLSYDARHNKGVVRSENKEINKIMRQYGRFGGGNRYDAVAERAKRIYTPWGRFKGGLNRGVTMGVNALNLASITASLKSMFLSLMGGFGKAIGLLANPITLTVAAIGGLGLATYKLCKYFSGTTEEQTLVAERMAKITDDAVKARMNRMQWFIDQMNQDKPPLEDAPTASHNKLLAETEEQKKELKQLYANDFLAQKENASPQAVSQDAVQWSKQNDEQYMRLILGNKYDELVGNLPNKYSEERKASFKSFNSPFAGTFNLAAANIIESNVLTPQQVEDLAENKKMVALMTEGASDPKVIEAYNGILDLAQQYDQKKISSLEYYLGITKLFNSAVNFAGKESAKGWSAEDLTNLADRSGFYEYQLGGMNLLLALINGDKGTPTGRTKSHNYLKEHLNSYSDEWWNALNNIVEEYNVALEVLDPNGNLKKVDVALKPLANWNFDFSGITSAVSTEANGAVATVYDFAITVATVYKQLAKANLVLGSKDALMKFIKNIMSHAYVSPESARSYYRTVIANDPNSVWVKFKKTEDEYVDFVTQGQGKTNKKLKFGNTTVSAYGERSKIRDSSAEEAANAVVDSFGEVFGVGEPDSAKKNSPINTAKANAESAKDQSAFISTYPSSAQKIPQININLQNGLAVNNLSVSSDLDKQKIVEELGELIPPVVGQLFLEAAHNQSSLLNVS